MKRLLLALALASFSPACPGAQTEPPNTVLSGTAKGTFTGEPETFKTEGEAVEHYRKALEESKGASMKAIYAAFGIVGDSNVPDESFTRMAPMMRTFAAHAGALVKVDRCVGPRLGDTVQRAGYILLYERGFGFVDTSLIHTDKGWRLLNLKLDFNNETAELLKAIPGEYYLFGQQNPAVPPIPAAKLPPPPTPTPAAPLPDWSAFSLVEPDENGGCTETIYLVNERAVPTTFDGNILVNPGESVRFVHIVAGEWTKNLTRSFKVAGQGSVPVRPVVLKGMAPFPDAP